MFNCAAVLLLRQTAIAATAMYMKQQRLVGLVGAFMLFRGYAKVEYLLFMVTHVL